MLRKGGRTGGILGEQVVDRLPVPVEGPDGVPELRREPRRRDLGRSRALPARSVRLVAAPAERMHSIRGGRIGMVFQEPMTALNPVKTIGDQVAETVLGRYKAPAAA